MPYILYAQVNCTQYTVYICGVYTENGIIVSIGISKSFSVEMTTEINRTRTKTTTTISMTKTDDDDKDDGKRNKN
jgi:hypothetical protein